MLWMSAVAFAAAWIVALKTANPPGLSVHVLLVIGAAFAALAVLQRRKLAMRLARSPRSPR